MLDEEDGKFGTRRSSRQCRRVARKPERGGKLVELDSQLEAVDASRLLMRPEVAVRCATASIEINKQTNTVREETAL